MNQFAETYPFNMAIIILPSCRMLWHFLPLLQCYLSLLDCYFYSFDCESYYTKYGWK